MFFSKYMLFDIRSCIKDLLHWNYYPICLQTMAEYKVTEYKHAFIYCNKQQLLLN